MKSETMIWPFVEVDLYHLLHQHPSFPDPLVVHQAARNDVRVFSLFTCLVSLFSSRRFLTSQKFEYGFDLTMRLLFGDFIIESFSLALSEPPDMLDSRHMPSF